MVLRLICRNVVVNFFYIIEYSQRIRYSQLCIRVDVPVGIAASKEGDPSEGLRTRDAKVYVGIYPSRVRRNAAEMHRAESTENHEARFCLASNQIYATIVSR